MGNLLLRRRALMVSPSDGGQLVENFVRVGNPTIENGILTCNATSWITTPVSFAPQSGDSWEIATKLYRPSLASAYEIFLNNGGVMLQTAWQSATTKYYLYADSQTIEGGTKNRSIPKAADRWIKVAYSGTKYDLGVSSDGVNYSWMSNATVPFTGYNAITSNLPIKSGVLQIGSSSTKAQFDLMATSIKINGAVWWTPYIRV